MLKMRGLITGIGSLPHNEADPALDLIFKYVTRAPFWPQLPRRNVREGMVAQFSWNLPCLKVAGGKLIFDAQDKERELEVFYERLIAQDLDYFKISEDFAQGLHKFHQRLSRHDLSKIEFIKCHITGPFTFAASISDDEGVSLLHNRVFMQAISKGLGMKALWQIRKFREFNKKIIVFIDEPYLGCFGSAYTPINRESVVGGLSEIAESIKSEGRKINSEDILIGVHCCGNTDWSIFTDASSIDIISFDAYSFLEKLILYARYIGDFLERGGILCWGIVPTQEFSAKVTASSLLIKIKDGIEAFSKKGLDTELVFKNLLLSPSCGLGTLDTEKAEKIFSLLTETADFLKK